MIFTRSATEALNLVAYAWGLDNLGPGDVVVVTELEHHANFVPWQFIALRTGAEFRHIPIDDNGELQLDALDGIAREGNVKVVANNLVSNTLGTINPVEKLAAWAHEQGAIMVVDAAQAAPHRAVDVQALGVRLPRLLVAQALRAERRGRAVGQARAARGDAPVQPGRRDDPLRRAREDDVQRAAVQVRGRHARDRRGRRVRRRDRLHHGVGLDAIEQHEHELVEQRWGARRAPLGPRLRAAARAPRGDRLVRRRGRAPARRRADPRLGRRRRPRRSPLHPAAHDAARRRGHEARELLPLLAARGGRPARRGVTR